MQESPLCVASMANLFLPEDLKLNSPRNFHSKELHTTHTILAAPNTLPLLQADACNKDAGECATVGASLLMRMRMYTGWFLRPNML